MTILVREARPQDLDAIARVSVAAFEQYRPAPDAPATPSQRAAFERLFADLANPAARLESADLFVAEAAGEIVGSAALYRPDEPPRYSSGRQLEPWPPRWACLRCLAVDPRCRGRGVARLLTDARIARARTLGALGLGLHTAPAFAVAHGMYLRAGWRRTPAHDYAPAPGVVAEAYVLSLTRSGAMPEQK